MNPRQPYFAIRGVSPRLVASGAAAALCATLKADTMACINRTVGGHGADVSSDSGKGKTWTSKS